MPGRASAADARLKEAMRCLAHLSSSDWSCPSPESPAFDRQARARAATRRHRNRAVGPLPLLSADDLAHHQRGAERDLVAGQSLAIR